jgi:hypothetical protein
MKTNETELQYGGMASKPLLSAVPIGQLIMCHNFDLKPYGMNAWCSMIDMYKLVIFWNTYRGKERRAIQVHVPTYEVKHPEKLEATSWSMFKVWEYTKREAYTTTEIDWEGFKSKFIEACLELKRHCA